MLTEEQRRSFALDGYVVVPGAVPEELLVASDREVDALVAERPPPPSTRGPHF